MVIKYKDSDEVYKVYAKAFFSTFSLYLTNKGIVSSYAEDYDEYDDFINKYESEYRDVKAISEDEFFTAQYIFDDYICDFSNEEDRNNFKAKKIEMSKFIENFDKDDLIFKNYIRWKIRNGFLVEWDNDFEERIIELTQTERYIDDKFYDIIYDTNDLDNISVEKKKKILF